MEQACAVWAAEAGAGVPARFGAHGAVVAFGDVVEACRLVHGVELRVDEAEFGVHLLVEDGDESGPERGYRAGAAYDHVLAIDADVVAGFGVGIAGYVGDAAEALGDYGGLPGWAWEDG